jgi:tRNA (mo5U34)-methyltransferase
VRLWRNWLDETGWWHSFDLPDGTRIRGVNSVEYMQLRLSQFPIAEDLTGKRVLDIGTWDGWFAFEMERRGAEVLAIDVWDNPRFHQMHSTLGSSVEHRIMDVYDLSPERVGRFDVVLFLGVLYHLKHPLLALERVCSVTTDLAAVDSFVLQERHRPDADVDTRPIMEFYEADEFGGQTDNWVGPSVPCLLAFCRTAGFARVELRSVLADSACVSCHRGWEPDIDAGLPAPRLTSTFHNTTFGINFSAQRDDYVTCFFEWEGQPLAREDVRPEVGEFGTKPIYVGHKGDTMWQANFKLPPGLPSGWHPVRIRIGKGAPSNEDFVAVDVPLPDQPVAITAVRDGVTDAEGSYRVGSERLFVWVDGLPRNADKENVRVMLASRRVPIAEMELERPDGGPRLVEVRVPDGVPMGTIELHVELGSRTSNRMAVEVTE